MIFPDADRALLTEELGTYGITYADSEDCLLVAPGLIGHPERIPEVFGFVSPLELLCLLMFGGEYVGVLFNSITRHIDYYWNNKFPEEVPTGFIVDMMDLCLAEAQYQNLFKSSESLCQARVMHALARELLENSGVIPEAVQERIRENIREYTDTVH